MQQKMMKHTGLKYSCKYNRIAASQAQIKAHCEGIRLISSREILAGSSQVHFFNEFREIDEVLGDCVFKTMEDPIDCLGVIIPLDYHCRIVIQTPKKKPRLLRILSCKIRCPMGKAIQTKTPSKLQLCRNPNLHNFFNQHIHLSSSLLLHLFPSSLFRIPHYRQEGYHLKSLLLWKTFLFLLLRPIV